MSILSFKDKLLNINQRNFFPFNTQSSLDQIISIMKTYINGIQFLFCILSLAVISQTAHYEYKNYLDELPSDSDFKLSSSSNKYHSKYYLEDLGKIKREIDGSNNNPQGSRWGATKAILKRQSGNMTTYEDGAGQPISHLPSPRQISNQIGSMQNFQPNDKKISMIYVIWGQFLDHDIVATSEQHGQKEHMNIKIPKGDIFFDQQGTGNKQMEFVRSGFEMINGTRFPSNQITAWVDGGTVYGSTEQKASKIRAFKDGKLKQSEFKMLPKDQTGKFFEAGDFRVNENFGLTSMHTLWVREHNRICDEIIKQNPHQTDEKIYQIARNYVIGLIQKITFHDFMPKLLGPAMYQKYFQKKNSYDPTIRPDIMLQMATGLFRVGHTLLNDEFSMRKQNGQVVKQFQLKDAFGRPEVFEKQTSLDEVLMGLMYSPAKQKTCQVIDSIRNFLVLDANNRQHKLDLFSLNLQRGRDHGIVSYGHARRMFGLKKVDFNGVCQKSSDARSLNKMYRNTDELDLWVGTICQKPVKDGIMGELGSKALGQFFSRLKYGDRLYFEWGYPKNIVDEIMGTSLGDVIKRNTKLSKMPKDSFQVIKNQIRQETSTSTSSQSKQSFSLSLDKYYKRWIS